MLRVWLQATLNGIPSYIYGWWNGDYYIWESPAMKAKISQIEHCDVNIKKVWWYNTTWSFANKQRFFYFPENGNVRYVAVIIAVVL